VVRPVLFRMVPDRPKTQHASSLPCRFVIISLGQQSLQFPSRLHMARPSNWSVEDSAGLVDSVCLFRRWQLVEYRAGDAVFSFS
jgi:hypothetical protein